MKTNTAFILAAVFGATSCVLVDISDTCSYPSQFPLHQYKPNSLTFVVGYPSQSNSESPYLALDVPGGETALIVQLAELDDSYELPSEFDKHKCKNVDFRAFDLEVESEDWDSYWVTAKESGTFSYGVALPDLDSPVRSRSIGFAFIDNTTQKSAVVCGCLAE